MCGIWGISDTGSNIERQLLLKMVKKLMILSETRGKDASGIAVMQGEKLNIIKKAMSSHELLKDSQFIRYLKENISESNTNHIWITGHSRLVTNGTQYNPCNNQPVAKRNMAFVHNGIIVNENELWDKIPELHRDYEVDTEVILETFYSKFCKSGDAKEAIDNTYKQLKGMASTLCLVQTGHYMIAASNNGSLYQCTSMDGKLTVFASESLMLKKLINHISELQQILSKESIIQLKPGHSMVISDRYTSSIDDIKIIQDLKRENTSANVNSFDYEKYEINFDKIRRIRRCTKCVLPVNCTPCQGHF